MRASVPVEVEQRLVQASEPAVFTDAEVDGRHAGSVSCGVGDAGAGLLRACFKDPDGNG